MFAKSLLAAVILILAVAATADAQRFSSEVDAQRYYAWLNQKPRPQFSWSWSADRGFSWSHRGIDSRGNAWYVESVPRLQRPAYVPVYPRYSSPLLVPVYPVVPQYRPTFGWGYGW